MRIALVPHIRQARTVAWTRAMVTALLDRGVEVVAAPDAADLIEVAATPFDGRGRSRPGSGHRRGRDGSQGGASGQGQRGAVLRINDGRLGYLADALPDDVPTFLDRMASGEWLTTERMLLAASINGDPPTIGLNDVVVEKVENQRTVRSRHLDRR